MAMSGDVKPPTDRVKSKPELFLRVITALVLIPVVLAAAWAGGIWFALLIALVIGLGGHEWTRLCNLDRRTNLLLLALLGPALAGAFMVFGPFAGLLVLLGAICITGAAHADKRIWPIGGLAYLGFPALAILILRFDPQSGLEALIFLFAIVWLTDIGAYAVGRLIGGPKLAPAISPGKTWAGAIGGLLFAVAGALGGAGFMTIQLPLGAIALALILSVATQCGDLLESWFKRRFGKKDSGTIMPGHGGILDRIDGLLFAAPTMVIIIVIQRGTVPLWP